MKKCAPNVVLICQACIYIRFQEVFNNAKEHNAKARLPSFTLLLCLVLATLCQQLLVGEPGMSSARSHGKRAQTCKRASPATRFSEGSKLGENWQMHNSKASANILYRTVYVPNRTGSFSVRSQAPDLPLPRSHRQPRVSVGPFQTLAPVNEHR